MELSVWVLFVITEGTLCLTPGPAVLYVVSNGLRYGGRGALPANLGIVTGNVIYFTLSAAGLGAVILASHTVFLIMKWAGAAYLIWLGLSMILARAESHGDSVPVVAAGRRQGVRSYSAGILVQLANPKNLVFFLAILPQFIDPTGDLALQVLILGVTSQVIEFVVLLGYGYAAGEAQRMARGTGLMVWFQRTAGAVLVGVGVSLTLIRPIETNAGHATGPTRGAGPGMDMIQAL